MRSLSYVIVMFFLNNAIKNINYKIMEENAIMQSYFKETLQGFEVIKANNIVRAINNIFMTRYKGYENSIYNGNLLNAMVSSIAILIEQVSNIIIIILGFNLVREGEISLGELLSFYMILSCLVSPIKDILSMQPAYLAAKVSMDRLEDIQYMEQEISSRKEKIVDKITSIEFKNVCFSYQGKEELLKNISFKVSGNKKIAITGGNGVGKSTLAKILLGFETIDSGTITINSKNIDEIDLLDIRNKVSYVMQTNFFFADTIGNNITLGLEIDSQKELEEYGKISGLDSFVNDLPLGYNTYICENGDNLSCGQKQSIAITRALIRKPQLLILDEATSNMDHEREQMVIQNILKLPIPCFIITHNQEIIDKMDDVLAL